MGFGVLCMGALRVQKSHAGQGAKPNPLAHTLTEVFTETAWDAAGIGFVLARLPRSDAPILWVQDRVSRRETGRPSLAGMGARSLITVDVSRAQDVLWAMEDGLRCKALGAVVGEVWGAPPRSLTVNRGIIKRKVFLNEGMGHQFRLRRANPFFFLFYIRYIGFLFILQ